eukprot:TRINITY_DN54552_c0_g1_i1.p1 TRINITY_DN54552_c0_g1~~TRINITY_DN54552_c0_g1_i1.p1  ORF type:complete len:617 (-),score=89.13 TRINITY_DN54552_c0_g1_i1:165-1748(-)
MFATGFLEGYLMKDDIEKNFENTFKDWFQGSVTRQTNGVQYLRHRNYTEVDRWLLDNYNWLQGNTFMVGTGDSDNEFQSEFWKQTGLLLELFEGLAAGVQAAGSWLTVRDLLLLNADGDLEDVVAMLAAKKHEKTSKRSRCSAMVKLARNNSDLFFGHTTWDHFDMMVRSLKTYDFQLKHRPRTVMTLSSSPGFLSSIDDFFISSNGLAIIETTNGITNDALFGKISSASVLSWVRALVATSLATDAMMWASLFSTANSGTYNNQWMILDLKLFEAHRPIRSNTFVVLEQIPGMVEIHDMSATLNAAGYWASYNVPAFPNIYESSGFPTPSIYSTVPRAKIFRTQQLEVNDLEDFKKLMRYNDWQRDPLSLGDACNAIAARCDLNNISTESWQLDGAIDAKVSTVTMGKTLSFLAQNGPTWDQQPPFTWETIPEDKTMSHVGQLRTYKLPWIAFHSLRPTQTNFRPLPFPVDLLSASKSSAWAISVIVGSLLFILALAFFSLRMSSLGSARLKLQEPLLRGEQMGSS